MKSAGRMSGAQAADKVLAAFFVFKKYGEIKETLEKAILGEQNSHQGEMELVIIDTLVPKDHLLRKINKRMDFSFIYDMCREYYFLHNGRPAIEPVIVLRCCSLGISSAFARSGDWLKKSRSISHTDGFWITN